MVLPLLLSLQRTLCDRLCELMIRVTYASDSVPSRIKLSMPSRKECIEHFLTLIQVGCSDPVLTSVAERHCSLLTYFQ